MNIHSAWSFKYFADPQISRGNNAEMNKEVAPQHGKDSRERILAAARTLFDHRGFHQTPMADLAVTAQVSVGQIYRLFKSKEDVISAIVEDDARSWNAQLAQLRKQLDDRKLTIEQVFEHLLLDCVSEHHDGLRFDILAESVRQDRVGDIVAKMCADIQEILRYFACVANPALNDDVLDVAEELLLACLFGIGHRRTSRSKMAGSQIAKESAHMIVKALRNITQSAKPA
jgi:TetR/AcrR family transcriptional repressor of uid operon